MVVRNSTITLEETRHAFAVAFARQAVLNRPSIFRKIFREKFVRVFRFFREKKGVRKMREMRKKICHIFGYFSPIF